MTKPLTEEQKALLHRIYYDNKMFFGRDRLFTYISSTYPDSGISRRKIANWLKTQEVAQLYKQTKTTRDIQPTILSGPYKQIAIDLADMQSNEYNGYKYILTAVDLFSKYAWARPLKNKTEKEVTKAMKDILESIGHHVSSIRSDNGSEFIANSFKKLLKDYEIKQVLSDAGKPQSNGGIERFNGTLKRLIRMTITHSDDHNWPDYLDDLIENYNVTKHRVTKKTPMEAISEDTKTNEKIRDNIRNAVIKKNLSIDNNKNLLHIGDRVRLKLQYSEHQKQKELWTREVYRIYKVFKSNKPYSKPYYYVHRNNHWHTDKLYREDLQVVNNIEIPVQTPKDQYNIKEIIGKKTVKGKVFYQVQWIGYKEPTWEPASNLLLDIPKVVERYERKNM